MDIRTTQLEPGQVFHVFNRGINGEKVFYEEKNYLYFLRQYEKYVNPFVETFAYCFLKNHFHFMIRVRAAEEIEALIKKNIEKPVSWYVSNGFSSFFQSYTRAMNKMYERTGPIFESPFKRLLVSDKSYFSQLILYIHCNPLKHKLVDNLGDYDYCSYLDYFDLQMTKAPAKKEVLNWFGGSENFRTVHQIYADSLSNLVT